jgi:signal transduction histidine kinase
VPVDDARKATDSSLLAEREQADLALREKLATGERKTDDQVEQAHAEISRTVAEVKDEAIQQTQTPAKSTSDLEEAVQQHKEELSVHGRSDDADKQQRVAEKALDEAQVLADDAVVEEKVKAQAAVERVANQAEKALENERKRFDELTDEEREQRKRDFLEILAFERRKTDQAMEVERGSSDMQVRSRDEILGVISHDLRNYLSVVAMKADMLTNAAQLRDTAALQALADHIAVACKIMARWAGDLVDLSSIETGSIALEPGVHDPAELINRSVQAFMPKADSKGVTLTIQVPHDRPNVLCDQDRLTQVLNNLLDNALKFTAMRGKVVVRLEVQEEGFVTVFVEDTGQGIPEADRAKVFERAWRATKGNAGGAGLGLHISKRIVEAHGGKIWVESKVGWGSSFFFTVPRAPEGATSGDPDRTDVVAAPARSTAADLLGNGDEPDRR